jgi:hypothetical protein
VSAGAGREDGVAVAIVGVGAGTAAPTVVAVAERRGAGGNGFCFFLHAKPLEPRARTTKTGRRDRATSITSFRS